jgi:CBS domain containing-hemolysin-like protein
MNGWELAAWSALAVIGLLGTALYSGLETGLYVVDRVKLEIRSAHGPRRAAARLLKGESAHPERLLATTLIGTTFFGDLTATTLTRILAGLGYSDWAILVVNAIVLTPVYFVFVDTLPKEYFRLESDRLMYLFARPLSASRLLLTVTGVLPLIRVFTRWASRIVGGEGEAGLALSARERITTLMKDSASSGALSESQAGLVDRVILFQQVSVGDEMTRWSRVQSVPADWSRDQVVRLLCRERHDFLPVVDRAAEGRVVGVIRFEDAFLRAAPTARALARAPARLPARMTLPEAVGELRRAELGVGIVEDNGRPVGIVTMAELLSPLLAAQGA